MQIVQYDLQNAIFQMQDLSLFTGWLQLFRWFQYKTIDKYLHVLTFSQIENFWAAIKIPFLAFESKVRLQIAPCNTQTPIKTIKSLIIKKVKNAPIPNVAIIAKSHENNF